MENSFIGIKEFYNRLRTVSSSISDSDTPTDFYYFNVYFYCNDDAIRDKLNLEEYRYFISAIVPPDFTIKNFNNGIGSSSDGAVSLSNVLGNYSTISSHSRVVPNRQTFQMSILNTGESLIENSIYNWLKALSRASIGGYKRVNMAIKFWSPATVPYSSKESPPIFVYYFTNIMPTSMPTWKAKQSADSSAITRMVTFAFDEFFILSEKEDSMAFTGIDMFQKDNVEENIKAVRNDMLEEAAALHAKMPALQQQQSENLTSNQAAMLSYMQNEQEEKTSKLVQKTKDNMDNSTKRAAILQLVQANINNPQGKETSMWGEYELDRTVIVGALQEYYKQKNKIEETFNGSVATDVNGNMFAKYEASKKILESYGLNPDSVDMRALLNQSNTNSGSSIDAPRVEPDKYVEVK